MNILVTGIHGFVGSNLVKSLTDSHTLYGLDLITPQKQGVTKTYSWNDLKNKDLPRFDVIIHLAGKAHDTKKQSREQEYFDVNTTLTRTIYDYFLASYAKKFIFFSSVKAVADTVDGDILTEDVEEKPKGPYGESKLLAEKYIQSCWPETNTEKQVYIMRPCMIHGSGNKGNLNLLFSIIRKGFPWPLAAFKNKRSFTSIDNLCYIIVKLVQSNIVSGVYNISDDEAISTNGLVYLMCDVLACKARFLHVPVWFANGLARAGDMLHLPLNTERLHKLTENYVVSNKKIKQAVGIKNMPVTAHEGLTKTLKSFSID